MSEAPTPVLDLEKDFGEIIGDPVAKYEQNFHRFNAMAEYIGEAPDAYRRVPPAKQISSETQRAQEKIAAARAQARQEAQDNEALSAAATRLPAGPANAPSTVMDAQRENRQAAAAEQHAD